MASPREEEEAQANAPLSEGPSTPPPPTPVRRVVFLGDRLPYGVEIETWTPMRRRPPTPASAEGDAEPHPRSAPSRLDLTPFDARSTASEPSPTVLRYGLRSTAVAPGPHARTPPLVVQPRSVALIPRKALRHMLRARRTMPFSPVRPQQPARAQSH